MLNTRAQTVSAGEDFKGFFAKMLTSARLEAVVQRLDVEPEYERLSLA